MKTELNLIDTSKHCKTLTCMNRTKSGFSLIICRLFSSLSRLTKLFRFSVHHTLSEENGRNIFMYEVLINNVNFFGKIKRPFANVTFLI